MKTKWTDREVSRILTEIIDKETLARSTDRGDTFEYVAMALGLSDGDAVPVGDDGLPVLKTPPETIAANIETARKWRAEGKPLWQLLETDLLR
jgi:hypothetical protein